MPDATCCGDGEHCCPSDLPVCDAAAGRCMPKPSEMVAGWSSGVERRGVPWASKTPALVRRDGAAAHGVGLAVPRAAEAQQQEQKRVLIS